MRRCAAWLCIGVGVAVLALVDGHVAVGQTLERVFIPRSVSRAEPTINSRRLEFNATVDHGVKQDKAVDPVADLDQVSRPASSLGRDNTTVADVVAQTTANRSAENELASPARQPVNDVLLDVAVHAAVPPTTATGTVGNMDTDVGLGFSADLHSDGSLLEPVSEVLRSHSPSDRVVREEVMFPRAGGAADDTANDRFVADHVRAGYVGANDRQWLAPVVSKLSEDVPTNETDGFGRSRLDFGDRLRARQPEVVRELMTPTGSEQADARVARLESPLPLRPVLDRAQGEERKPLGQRADVTRMVSSGIIVVSALWLLLILYRKQGPRSRAPGIPKSWQVVDVIPLAAKRQLHLIRVGQRLLLLNLTASSIEKIAEITDPDEVNRILYGADGYSRHSLRQSPHVPAPHVASIPPSSHATVGGSANDQASTFRPWYNREA